MADTVRLSGGGFADITVQVEKAGSGVTQYASLADFPLPGDSGLLYIDITANLLYRWDGTGQCYVLVGGNTGHWEPMVIDGGNANG